MKTSEGRLKAHIARCHVDKREVTDLSLLSKILYSPVSHTTNDHWISGLSFLCNLHLSKPTFRQSLITKIQGRTEQAVIETFVDLLDAVFQANETASSDRLRHSPDYGPYPIWLLLILFEQLVLIPSLREDPKESDSTLNQ